MDDLQENELFRVRLRFLDLVKSFFAGEPDAEKIARWRGTFSALAQEQISPAFDSAVREMSRALSQRNLEELQDEYYKLFVNPFEGEQIETTASFYLNGRSYDQALVEVRQLMDEAGLKKDKAFSDPEDDLVVMLDTFASLVEEEKTGGGELCKQLQGKLLQKYLEPVAHHLSAALEKSEHGVFYALCCRLLEGYLELEKGLLEAV